MEAAGRCSQFLSLCYEPLWMSDSVDLDSSKDYARFVTSRGMDEDGSNVIGKETTPILAFPPNNHPSINHSTQPRRRGPASGIDGCLGYD